MAWTVQITTRYLRPIAIYCRVERGRALIFITSVVLYWIRIYIIKSRRSQPVGGVSLSRVRPSLSQIPRPARNVWNTRIIQNRLFEYFLYGILPPPPE